MQKLTAQDVNEWSKIAHSIRNTTSLASEFSLHRHPLLMQERDQHLARGSSQTRANLYTHKSIRTVFYHFDLYSMFMGHDALQQAISTEDAKLKAAQRMGVVDPLQSARDSTEEVDKVNATHCNYQFKHFRVVSSAAR